MLASQTTHFADRGAPCPATATDRTDAIYDVTTPEGLISIARVRERFFEAPETDLSGIRPRIARAWRRTASMRVDATAPLQIDDTARVDEQTLRCAAPFVSELERLALESGGDVTVISPGGSLVHDLTPAIQDRYPDGLVLLESVCGTNGDGTALEEGHGGWVFSQEHHRSDFSSTGCYSVLIRDPFRDNVRACVTLTLPESVILASDPRAIALVVEGMAAKVTRELASRSATREQLLFAEYLKVARRHRNGAILAIDGKHTTVSDPALELLREDDFAAIASYAHESLRLRRSVTHAVTLSGGRLVQLCISLAGSEHDPLGAIVVVKARSERPSGPQGGGRTTAAAAVPPCMDVFDSLIGDSQGFRRALGVASTVAARPAPAHVLGEPGTGRRTIALRIADAWGAEVETVDAARLQGTALDELEAIRRRFQAGGAVILRGADELSIPAAESLLRVVRTIDRPKLVLTLRRPTASASLLMSFLNTVEIAIPALKARREDIPALATRFIADLTDKRPSARLLYVLSQADWPRNVSQLKSAVEQAAMIARGPEICTADLPQSFHAGVGRGSMSRLEEVELHELRAALDEAHGNRSLAANILQIGRSTLYRRLDSYHRRGIVI